MRDGARRRRRCRSSSSSRRSRKRASSQVSLHLLGAPAGIGLAHVGGRLDGGDELEHNVADADEADDGAGDNAQPAVVQQDRADKDVEGAAADEGEEERGVSRDLGWDLELEEAGCWRTERTRVSLFVWGRVFGCAPDRERKGTCLPAPKMIT